MASHTPLRIPDHLSRADIGAYMRDLRTHYGLSEQDVSQQLHLRAKYITAIETAEYDAMPGKAYARGYVHTYAEFLGLDADQVAERCFGSEPLSATATPLPRPARSKPRSWKAILLILAIVAAGYAALQHEGGEEVEASSDIARVEAVPEDYLDGLRTLYMPLPEATPCIEGAMLGCVRFGLAPRTSVPDMSPMLVEPLPPVETDAAPTDEVTE